MNARAIELTQALLLLSRADQGSFTRDRVDLSIVVEEATETLLAFAEARGVSTETSGPIVFTTGLHALLLQLVTNLVHNAVVHNVAEHRTVGVTTAMHDDAVAVTVENTGEQLAPDVVPGLIEPFRRGAGRLHTGHRGAGLGLAIVQSIVVAHGGTLTLVARPGGGLSVTVRLPAAPRVSPP